MVPTSRQLRRRSSRRRSCAAGDARRSCLTLLVFGLLAIQTQQKLIEFTDCLQRLLHLLVAIQGLANLRHLLWAKTHLAGLATRITDIENPEWMAFSASTFRTTAGVMNRAFEQRATKNIAEVGEFGGEAIPVTERLRTRHHS